MLDKRIKVLQQMKPFKSIEDIPPIPVMESELYKEYVIPNFIRCGAIPKKDLLVDRTYLGDCRNSNMATWNGEKFVYTRCKFGMFYDEFINHFEDDDGFDLFVPIKLLEDEA